MAKYSEDEFDRLAAERTSFGAHRRPVPFNPWLVALVAVLLIAPLLGWFIGNAMSSSDDSSSQTTSETSQTATEETSDAATDAEATDGTDQGATDGADGTQDPGSGDGTASEESTDAADQATDEATDVDYTVDVRVLNARGTAGWAAENAGILNQAGFSNTNTGDYVGGADPAVSTVYYASPDLADEAQAVADALGVTAVQDGSAMGLSASIVVVMR